MGIYGALSSAVTGLRAQAHALENISGNIANSQTTGYKRIETDFLDLIADAPISRQVPGAVLAQSRGTNDIGGDIKTVSNETFIALNSNGFFVVEPKIGQTDGKAVFADTNFFTRRGDFEIDKDGMLVNGAGYYLKGLPIDTRTGNISGSVPEVIKLSNSFLAAQQSNRINYQANLPQLPKTTGYDKATFNSELMQPHNYPGSVWAPASVTGTVPMPDGTVPAASFFVPGETVTLKINGTSTVFEFNTTVPYTGTNQPVDVSGDLNSAVTNLEAAIRANGGPSAASATVDIASGALKITLGKDSYADLSIESAHAASGLTAGAAVTGPSRLSIDSIAEDKNTQFLANSISGGAVTVYAENGAPANVQLRWAKVSSSQAGGTDTWNLYYMSDSRATGSAEMWKRVPNDFTFGPDGSLKSPTEPSVPLTNLSINGVAVGTVEFRFETNGLSQFADVNGTANVSTLNQNGYGAGEFVSVAINDNGRVTATYSNGERIDMAQVVTAEFNAINKLKRLDGGVFSSTSESGEAILDLSGSGIIGGALEASNTDISDEFTKLIVTQQAYAAGTRIVSTADEMLQEALNMVR